MLEDNKLMLKNLRTMMNAAKISPRELAHLAGIKEPSFYNFLSGKVEPKLATLQACAKVLNVSVSQIIGEKALASQPQHSIPIIDWSCLNVNTGNIDMNVNINSKFVTVDYTSTNLLFALKVNNTISPLYLKDSIIILENTSIFKNQDIVLISIQGKPPVLQKVIDETDRIFLKSLSSDLPPYPYNQQLSISFGVVREVRIIH